MKMVATGTGFIIPRRISVPSMTDAEKAICEAMRVVESAGAHLLLTEAINLLTAAQNRVADFVELDPPVKVISDPITGIAHWRETACCRPLDYCRYCECDMPMGYIDDRNCSGPNR